MHGQERDGIKASHAGQGGGGGEVGEDGRVEKGGGVADITDLRRHFRRLWTIVRRLPVKLSSCKSTRGSST